MSNCYWTPRAWLWGGWQENVLLRVGTDGRWPELGESTEPLYELRLDPQHSPRISVHPVGGPARFQQPLVGRAGLHLVTAEANRSLARLSSVVHGRKAIGLTSSRGRTFVSGWVDTGGLTTEIT